MDIGGRKRKSWELAASLAIIFISLGADAEETNFTGDIGLAAYHTRSIIRGRENNLSILPYADFNFGRLFARVDTLGVKLLPMGYGYLEFAGRFNQDGFRTDVPELSGLKERSNSVPLGMGTLQVTSVGGFYLNAFRDVNESGGNMVEMIYGAKLEVDRVVFYPMAGMEYRSGSYVRHFYGISGAESVASGYAVYQPGAATNMLFAVIADVRLVDGCRLNFYFRRKWLGDSMRNSPIVARDFLDTAYIALSYRY